MVPALQSGCTCCEQLVVYGPSDSFKRGSFIFGNKRNVYHLQSTRYIDFAATDISRGMLGVDRYVQSTGF